MAEPRLLHFGSAVIDFIYRLERLPEPGDDVIASGFLSMPGGGFNMMAAARRSGMDTAFAGRIGDGVAGAMLHKALVDEGIDCLQPKIQGEDTGVCIVLVTADGERTFVSRPGAECRLVSSDLEAIEKQPGDWFFTSGYTLVYPECRDEQARFIENLPCEYPFAFDRRHSPGHPHIRTPANRLVELQSGRSRLHRRIGLSASHGGDAFVSPLSPRARRGDPAWI